MKALVQDGYGSADALQLREVATPAVADDGVLVRVCAASVNALDWHTVHLGRMFNAIGLLLGSRTSPTRGADLAGQVEAVGNKVTRFRAGDEVFGTAAGAFAEYAAAKEDRLAPRPRDLSFAQAATLGVAAVTALQGLRDKGGVQPGHRVLINGAGGGVGTFAVQIGKALGAHVAAVTGPRNLDVVANLGPDELVDRAREDFTRRGRLYDVVFDVAADRPFRDCRRVLTPNGKLVLAGAAKSSAFAMLSRAMVAIVRARAGSRWLVPLLAKVTRDDLLALKELVEAGKLRPVIDREYPLGQAADAVRYVGSGQARAKIVITVP
jgi:NADPH:quinone reductase-like Zn-dependent oxidoreductase